ncbi:aspartate--tRNA ligase [Candidatus Wolfebacteria bacterium]|nr:aspartate--tRNA ligase [Candidatus Wolfebacteria bacterium]
MRSLNKEIIGKEGETVELAGWVNARRDHGRIVFIDLRDRSGVSQLVFLPQKEDYEIAETLRGEWVIKIEGRVKRRPAGMENPDMITGQYEVEVDKLAVLSEAQTPPFDVLGDGREINEDVRMEYRYLDLRRPRMRNNIRLHHEGALFVRQYLAERGFTEIETPILTKTTPEGARDFLVPSRLRRGAFYALPQSPQQYKQLLMIAGFERYFQMARCFRDEDPRADRAYGEFTQLDIEMSFVTQADILELTETLFTELTQKLFPYKRITQTPWPRLSHREAMEHYGSDKPDLRRNTNDPDELAFAWLIDFPLFTEQSAEDFFHGSGSGKLAPSHHMFTAPHPDDIDLLDSDPGKVRGLQHDMVLNGFEVGGGSIRIHNPQIQEKIFTLIGFTEKQKEEFSHILRAFTYGVPPHGGIAPGFDRFLYAVLGEKSIREVIAFPASAGGKTSVMDAPSTASPEQLKELHIKVVDKE